MLDLAGRHCGVQIEGVIHIFSDDVDVKVTVDSYQVVTSSLYDTNCWLLTLLCGSPKPDPSDATAGAKPCPHTSADFMILCFVVLMLQNESQW